MTMQSRLRTVNQACCVPSSICKKGAPATCNSQCAHVFLSFYNLCYSSLVSMKSEVNIFDELAIKCNVISGGTTCLSKAQKAAIQTSLKCVESTPSLRPRALCAEQVKSILGLAGMKSVENVESCMPVDMDLPLLEDVEGNSKHNHSATLHGDTYVADGAHFDGLGDYMTVPNFQYAASGKFTISMWISKEQCTHSIYEYLYSHSKRVGGRGAFSGPPGTPNPATPNPNVHLYIGCEGNGMGWSGLKTSMLRTNIFDDRGTALMIDYPLWKAGDFSKVTNQWVSLTMSMSGSALTYVVDGDSIPDSSFGFYIGNQKNHNLVCKGNVACDQRSGKPVPGHLWKAMGPITFGTDIVIGGRNDLQADRHFVGKIAGVVIASHAATFSQSKCVFQALAQLLPAKPQCTRMLAEMQLQHGFQLEMSLMGSQGSTDTSGAGHKVLKFGGDVILGDTGASFDGKGDFIAIQNFNYANDGDFSISFMVSKNTCSKSDKRHYQYIFSHNQHADGARSGITDKRNSNVNIFIGCNIQANRTSDGRTLGGSTAGTTILRYNLVDANGVWAIFDYDLANAPSFSRITKSWTHVVLSVTRHSIVTYVDGNKVKDRSYGFLSSFSCTDMRLNPPCPTLAKRGLCKKDMAALSGNNPQVAGQTLQEYCSKSCHNCKLHVAKANLKNSAYPYPSRLRNPLGAFNMTSDIVLGARADFSASRHFQGVLADLKIYSSPLLLSEATCMFIEADARETAAMVQSGGGHR